MCFFIGKKHDIQRYMLRFPVQAENNAENVDWKVKFHQVRISLDEVVISTYGMQQV